MILLVTEADNKWVRLKQLERLFNKYEIEGIQALFILPRNISNNIKAC